MSNARLFSPEMFETFEVEVDFWENQRYKPLGGWAPPYLGTLPNHSNLVGDKAVEFEKVDQLACLPEGWSWVESKWEVDIPEARRPEVKSFPIRGETDGDGWSYAGSMETLIKSAQDRLLLSERSAMNTARRRRWRRTRRCVQGTAKKIENYRRDYVKKTCRSIDTAIDQSTKLATTMQDFHYKWRRSVDNVLRINDKLNKDTAAQLVFVRSKLTLLKECLMDIGQIEAAYAAKLRGFSSKWMNAGQRDFNRQAIAHKEEESITRRLSMTLLGASNSTNLANAAGANGGDGSVSSDDEAGDVAQSTTATESADEENEDKGFFRAIARANEEIADHKNVFASSLNSLLPSDIDRILSDLEDLIEDHLSETSHTRSQLLTLREVAEETLSVCVSAAFNATRRLSIERSVYMDSLSVISALWDARTELVPPLLNEELVDVNNIYPSLEAVSSATAEAQQHHSHTPSYAAVTGHATQDSWFLLLRYAQTLVQANASMLLLHAQSKVYQRKMTQQCTSVSDLLMSLVKLFAHEHFRCYSEAQGILLDAIGAIQGGMGKSVASTEGDAEHDLQQLHSQQLAQATLAATGTLKVSQSHVEAIRQRHMQALPSSTKDVADDASLLSHQGLNEEDLAAHLATTAIAPVTEQQPRRHILGAPVNRSTSTNKIDNNNNNNNNKEKSPMKKGPVEMPPLATILPFIGLFRSKILCMAEVRFLCLAPAATQQVAPQQQSSPGVSLANSSLAASVPHWRWQKAVLVLTQDLCLHLLDLGVSSSGSSSGSSGSNPQVNEEQELTMEDFYRAVDSGLDSFRVLFTCSIARASVLPLLLTTDSRFANTFQIRLHPAYHTMTLTPTTHSHTTHDHHEASVSHGNNATSGMQQKMESAASSFFSSMFSSSLTSHATGQQQQHHHHNQHHNHHQQAAAAASHTSSNTTSDTALVNLSSVMSVFVGNNNSNNNNSSTALATSLSSTLTSSAATQLGHTIAAVEAIHATGKYAAVQCEPRPANTYHANIAQVANVCALLIAPVSAATTAMLLKKLSSPFCDVSLKTPEGFANDVLANPSGEIVGLDTAVGGSGGVSSSVASSSVSSSSVSNTNAASSYFVASMSVPSSSSSSSAAAAMGTDEDDFAIASANPMMGLSTSSASTSASTSSSASVSVSSTSVSSGLSTSNTANTSSSSSAIGNSTNTSSNNNNNSNGVSSSSGSSSVPMMANPLMKNPLKRTSSAVMKKQQMSSAGNNAAGNASTNATSATISEEK